MPSFYAPLLALLFLLAGCAGRPPSPAPLEPRSPLEEPRHQSKTQPQSCQGATRQLETFRRLTEREFSRLLAYLELLEARLQPYHYQTQRGEIFAVFTAHHLSALMALERILPSCLGRIEFAQWRRTLAARLVTMMKARQALPRATTVSPAVERDREKRRE